MKADIVLRGKKFLKSPSRQLYVPLATARLRRDPQDLQRDQYKSQHPPVAPHTSNNHLEQSLPSACLENNTWHK